MFTCLKCLKEIIANIIDYPNEDEVEYDSIPIESIMHKKAPKEQ